MRSWIKTLAVCLFTVLLSGCAAQPVQTSVPIREPIPDTTSELQPVTEVHDDEEEEIMKIRITVGDTVWMAVPEENTSAEAFLNLLEEGEISVHMADFAGMEKVGSLGTELPRNDIQRHVNPGDVILYQGAEITIYYGTNDWSLTRLAVIENADGEELHRALGNGDVDVTFALVRE